MAKGVLQSGTTGGEDTEASHVKSDAFPSSANTVIGPRLLNGEISTSLLSLGHSMTATPSRRRTSS
jgi:hypothetical protein